MQLFAHRSERSLWVCVLIHKCIILIWGSLSGHVWFYMEYKGALLLTKMESRFINETWSRSIWGSIETWVVESILRLWPGQWYSNMAGRQVAKETWKPSFFFFFWREVEYRTQQYKLYTTHARIKHIARVSETLLKLFQKSLLRTLNMAWTLCILVRSSKGKVATIYLYRTKLFIGDF